MIVAKDSYVLKDDLDTLESVEMDNAVRDAFQLDSQIQWRWPFPGVRIYNSPADGFIPVWLEHLRSRWNPRCPMFIKHLCKYVYKLSPM